MLLALRTLLLIATLNETVATPEPLFTLPDSYNIWALESNDTYLVLLAPSEPQVRVFDHHGKHLFSWGTKGEGPEEFTSVQDLALFNDHIWILNKLPAKVVSFEFDGTHHQTMTMPDLIFPQSFAVGNTGIYIQEGGNRLQSNSLLLYSQNHSKTLLTLDMGTFLTFGSKNGITCRVTSPFTEKDHWALRADEGLILNRKGKATIAILDPMGKDIEEWHLENKQYKTSQNGVLEIWLNEQFPQVKNGMGLPTMNWRKEASKTKVPETFPSVLKLIIDENRLWVQRAVLLKGQLWECYEDKKKVKQVWLPKELRVCDIHHERLYAVDPRNPDTPVVAYSIP